MTALLEVENLQVAFGTGPERELAVADVSFAIPQQGTFALLGESGSGKSVTALSVMRLLPEAARIEAGHVRLRGQDLLDLPEAHMRTVRGSAIGMIFQEPMTSLNPVMTVGQQIGESLRRRGLPKAEIRTRARELLDAVRVPDARRRLNEYPHHLSGGMQQRVMIAAALAGEPELLIADEPTTALDVTIQAQVLELLRELQRELGMAMLFITHDLAVARHMADAVAIMQHGRIVEAGSAEAFFANPSHAYSRNLFAALPDISKRGQRLHGIEAHDAGPEADHAPAASEAPVLLEVEDLRVHFPIRRGVFRRVVGHVPAVDGLTFALREGETFALVGESGCGKTTTGKSLIRLLPATQGRIRYRGKNLAHCSAHEMAALRAEMQIIFQDPFASLNPRMTVGDIIAEGMQELKVLEQAAQRQARVLELLEQVGLKPAHRNRYPHEFSGGQRQRIAIARALAVNPKLIVCDEPTSALDVTIQAQILNLLREIQKRHGLTYLFITHNIAVVSWMAHRMAVMRHGRIVEQGEATEVLRNARHAYTRELLAAAPRL